MKLEIVPFLIFSVFCNTSFSQFTGNVSDFYHKNINELRLKNVNHTLYNLKNGVVELCDWSYLLDENGNRYNEKQERCFKFNENHEVESRMYKNSRTGRSYETKYLNFKNDKYSAKNEYDSEGELYKETVILYNGSIEIGYKEKYRNNSSLDTFMFKTSIIGDSVVVDKTDQLNYYLNNKLVKRISGSHLKEYQYHKEKEILSTVSTFRNGNLIAKDSFDLDGALIVKFTKHFKSNGAFDYSELEQMNYRGGQIKNIKKYFKDQKNETVEELEFKYNYINKLVDVINNYSGNRIAWLSVDLNSKGDVVKFDSFDKEIRYENYKYDRKGNWIYREKLIREMKRYEERRITYK